MPPGRPPKRPGEADIADLDGSGASSAKCKLPRLDRGERPGRADFSSVVKSKLQSYTRTGQACDRCKVRYTCTCAHARACVTYNISISMIDDRDSTRGVYVYSHFGVSISPCLQEILPTRSVKCEPATEYRDGIRRSPSVEVKSVKSVSHSWD